MTYAEERAIIALGNHDKPLREQCQGRYRAAGLLAQLEDKGYVHPTCRQAAGTWMLTDSASASLAPQVRDHVMTTAGIEADRPADALVRLSQRDAELQRVIDDTGSFCRCWPTRTAA
jgi:hypothetical protein